MSDMASTPMLSLPECIEQFNKRFQSTFDPAAGYDFVALDNLSYFSSCYCEPLLAYQFKRHAENALHNLGGSPSIQSDTSLGRVQTAPSPSPDGAETFPAVAHNPCKALSGAGTTLGSAEPNAPTAGLLYHHHAKHRITIHPQRV